jgi:uncharacterized membrane protein
MEESSRGPLLTTFAVLFVILAISNISKPLAALDSSDAGFVFFGVKTHGVANAILGPVFGVLLIAYAIGIWRMRRWALPLGYAYAAYVIVNTVLFLIRSAGTPGLPPPAFMFVYVVVGVGVSLGSALMLRRRQAQLV